MRVLPLFLAAALMSSCTRSEPVMAEPVAPPAQALPAAKPPPPVATPAPSNPVLSAIAPKKEISWKLPQGPLSEAERPLVGTWVATVGDYATRTAFMSDKVMFNLQGAGGGVEGIVEALKNDNRVKTSCIWLELFEDRKGIRRECALFNGEPSALDLTNPLTGKKSDSGATLEWFFDPAAKGVRVRFEADMLVPALDEKTKAVKNLRFRHWTLRLGNKEGKGFQVQESVPEHDYELPVRYVYEIFEGSFLGDR